MVRSRRIWASLTLILSVLTLWAPAYAQSRRPDVHFVPTPEEVVMEMLKMARVTQNDVVYDLGCGDGRIVITAAKIFGARGVGVDIDPVRIAESKENARWAGVTDRVKFVEEDLFKLDIHEATVVSLYLLPELNLQLRPKLLSNLKPGTRIISHEFDMGDWKPDNTGVMRNMTLYYNPNFPSVKDSYYYYWVIPADVAGVWRWTLPGSTGEREFSLRLEQKFQVVSGEVAVKGQQVPIAEARLTGDELIFTFDDNTIKEKSIMRFIGRVTGDALSGTVEVQGGSQAGSYKWTARRNP